MKKEFVVIDISIEKPQENWRGFVLTSASGDEFKRIALYLKDKDMWIDGDMYKEEVVKYWLKEISLNEIRKKRLNLLMNDK